MTRSELSRLALHDLDLLIATRQLPEVETRARVSATVSVLCAHPESGQWVGPPFDGARMAGVGWGWLCLLYLYDEAADVVSIVRCFDIRTRGAPRP